ncbi:MAG: hypothetical protein N2Z69_01700 [Methylophilaceae bacterium]|nr:hypothetical protein [Methylophilaceae bacterium]
MVELLRISGLLRLARHRRGLGLHAGFCERWASYGYDIDAADCRRAECEKIYQSAATLEEAMRLDAEFEDQEKAIAIAQGVPPDDPDRWRVDAAKKYCN